MNESAQKGLDDFIQNFTQMQAEDSVERKRRTSCLYLYRRYLAHCAKYAIAMAPKAQFAGAVFNRHGLLPEAMPTGGGQVHNFFDRLIFTGIELWLGKLTPEMQVLVQEHSPLDFVAIEPTQKKASGRDRRPRN